MSHDNYKANTYSKFTKHGDKGIRASYHKKNHQFIKECSQKVKKE